MKIAVFTRGEQSHSYKYEMAFLDGLKSHGHKPSLVSWQYIPTDLDLAVIWGVNNTPLINCIERAGADYLVLERGYIGDREEYTSCGFNGLNGRADFCDDHRLRKRAKLFEEYLKPVRKNRSTNRYIVIMGQVASDASVRHIGFNLWLSSVYEMLKRKTNRPIFYRPHPLEKEPYIPEGLQIIHGELHDVMQGSYMVVTLNSNTGVDAILSGIPCAAMDKGSMIWDLKANITNPKHIEPINEAKRRVWFNKLCYTQWSLEEMRSGEAWEYLKKKY